MASTLCKSLLHRSNRIATSRFHIQFLIPLRFLSTATDHHSFAVSYLVNKCGLPQELAFTASRRVNFEDAVKRDSVLAFFRDIGLSDRQISTIIRKLPKLLLSDLQKNLVPKVEFFRSLGLSNADVAKNLSRFPSVLTRSLEKQIVPTVDFLRNTLQSDAKTIAALNRYMLIIYHDVNTCLLPNFNTLREAGVSESNIVSLLKFQPKPYLTNPAKFKEIVEEVKNLGFDPSKCAFIWAVFTATSLSKSNLERKFQVFRDWGWSEEDCLQAFRRSPMYVLSSEEKIARVMDFFVNTMKLQPGILVKLPNIVTWSLENRIVPRGLVIGKLLSKGLIKKFSLHWFQIREELFLEKFVYRFKSESAQLLKLYQKAKKNTLSLKKAGFVPVSRMVEIDKGSWRAMKSK